jgi:hypothetical protein
MNGGQMNESLVKLFMLQKIDREIMEREKIIIEIPQKTKELEDQIEERKEILEEIEQRLKQNNNKELAIDRKLQETRMNIGRHKRQLLTVKTNKEYAAMLKEISNEEANIERFEEEIISLLDEIEGIEEEKREEEKSISKMQESYRKKKEALEEKKVKFEEEIKEKKIRRENIKSEIDGNLLKRYERIKELRDGIAIVRISGENCSGCYTTIPPQIINEAKKGDRILTCESCGRILIYWEEEMEIGEE